jgi:hypothetical protein
MSSIVMAKVYLKLHQERGKESHNADSRPSQSILVVD